MNRTLAQFVILVLLIGSMTAIAIALVLHAQNLNDITKGILDTLIGALATGAGVGVHSLFGNFTEIKS